MKKLGFILMFALCSLGYLTAQNGPTNAPDVKFTKTVHDFGKVAEEAGKVTCTFEFSNTGSAPLLINDVRTSCGCTTPTYPKEPIMPGQRGEIKVGYSTTNRVGAFEKGITVFTNVPDATYRLTIKGEVTPKK